MKGTAPKGRVVVYFVQAETIGLIKIGVATRIEHRLRGLAHHSPDRLRVLAVQICEAGEALEAELHKRFAGVRAHGEWFHPSAELLAHIAAIDTSRKALVRLNAVASFPTMPRGRPTKELMRQREVAGLGKWL